ncbi:class II aldolase/adducin family protein, partial [Klebsiella pneumoniae]|uniref:class II aldolase/adducin family protein n=1 Tax=Klebsiella pneumoniae TaxID=573 RepID=UPI003390150A
LHNPACKAIVHLHSHYLTALSCLQGLVARHCCKVSDEAAFCLIQRPYISKTLLTRRISPRGSP